MTPVLGVAGVGGSMAIYGVVGVVNSLAAGCLTSGLYSATFNVSAGALLQDGVLLWLLLFYSPMDGQLASAAPLLIGALWGVGDGVFNTQTSRQLHYLGFSSRITSFVPEALWNPGSATGGEDGQLGHGDAEDRPVPTVLSAFDAPGVVSVICGADHTTAYSDDEMQLYSWGWGDFGRLGHGNSSDLFNPQPIKALQGLKIKQIACGDSHCLAVTLTGQVQSWGRNQNGQLGLGNTEDCLLPQKIQAFEKHPVSPTPTTCIATDSAEWVQGVCVKMIAAGAEHTAAVTEDGDLYGWGWGRYGNLGLGDRNDRLVPEKVSSVEGEKTVLVACGWRHTITVSSSGSLYTYGWSKYGQLGHGDFEDHLVPHKLGALKDSSISQISGGWRHTMALTADGKLYGWGWNKVILLSGSWVDAWAILQKTSQKEALLEGSRRLEFVAKQILKFRGWRLSHRICFS